MNLPRQPQFGGVFGGVVKRSENVGIESKRFMVRPGRFELPTFCSGGKRSIQLSYGRTMKATNLLDSLCREWSHLRGCRFPVQV